MQITNNIPTSEHIRLIELNAIAKATFLCKFERNPTFRTLNFFMQILTKTQLQNI